MDVASIKGAMMFMILCFDEKFEFKEQRPFAMSITSPIVPIPKLRMWKTEQMCGIA